MGMATAGMYRPISEPDGPGLGRLLWRLHRDPDRAAAAYQALRRSLVRFLRARGAWFPDESADAAIDRLARKLERGAEIADLRTFALGIARLVLLEQWRHKETCQARIADAELDRVPAPEPRTEEPHGACLEQCLARLAPESRELLLQYYAGEGRERILGRRRLAEAHGLSESALRNRVQRLRNRLQRWMARCPCASAHLPLRRDDGPASAAGAPDTSEPQTSLSR
jgi:DNA-directed RNA polymerase specialized sigma24 family protein